MKYTLSDNDIVDFARLKGSKDKKKRNIQKAAAVGAGLAIAGGMGYAMNRYGLKQLGKTLNKKRPKLIGSSGSNQLTLPAGRSGGSLAKSGSGSLTNRSQSSAQKVLPGSSQRALPPGRQGGDITKQKALPPSLDPDVYNAYRKKLPAGKPLLSAGFDASPTRKSNIYRAGNPNQAVNRGNALPERTRKTRGRPKKNKNK